MGAMAFLLNCSPRTNLIDFIIIIIIMIARVPGNEYLFEFVCRRSAGDRQGGSVYVCVSLKRKPQVLNVMGFTFRVNKILSRFILGNSN